MSWVWETSRAKGTDRLVLLAIADHASDDGTDAYPSVGRLVRRTSVDARTVQRAIRRLVDLGELQVDEGAGLSGSNRYAVDMTPRQVATPGNMPPLAQRHPRQSATPAESPLGGGNLTPTPRQSATQTVLNQEQNLEASESAHSVARTTSTVNDDKPTDEVRRLCVLLADLIAENDADRRRPTVGKTWYRECRLLIEADKRPVEKIERAIRWSQADAFWHTNVLSMTALRKHYAKMQLQATASGRGTVGEARVPAAINDRNPWR